MTTFEYKSFDTAGHHRKGLVEALDLKDARELLAKQGLLVEKIQPATTHTTARGGHRSTSGLAARAAFYRELSALLKAGLPLAQALDTLIQTPEMGEWRVVLAGLRDRIREGASFSVAWSKTDASVSAFEQATMTVGERTGALDALLERLAAFLEEQSRLSDKIQTALLYPAVVLAVAIIVVTIMMGVMVPRLSAVLTESRIPLPPLTQIVMAAGNMILPVAGILLMAGGVFFFTMRQSIRRDIRARIRLHKQLFAIPLLRRGAICLANLRFARTLSLLLRGGVPLIEGLPLAGRATGNAWVQSLVEAQVERVRHGRALSDAVRDMGPLSSSLPGWIKAGEVSGHLDDLLDSASERYRQQWDKLVTSFLNLLEPVLILIVGGFVLMISLAILLPILQLNKTLM